MPVLQPESCVKQKRAVWETYMRNAGVAAIELLLVDRLLPSDSYSLDSVVGDLFSGSSPLFHIIPAVSW
jgi:hypothetical protein